MGFWGPSTGQQSPGGLGLRTALRPAPPDHSGQGPDYSARPPRCWLGLFAWPAQESRSQPLNTPSVSEVLLWFPAVPTRSSPSTLASSPSSSGAAAATDGYREALSEEADRDPGAGAAGPQLGHAGGCGLPWSTQGARLGVPPLIPSSGSSVRQIGWLGVGAMLSQPVNQEEREVPQLAGSGDRGRLA